ncbi:MAG TPA: hypothetical protein VFV33_13460, partial [Gemmatimonadaceae bacterium]|nr:hypothetical protein [Gemmatimonadaceae bacterium]
MSIARTVSIARVPGTEYDASEVRAAIREVARLQGWDGGGTDAAPGGAFGALIPAGAKVLVKPNLVLHDNQGPWGIVPLFTQLAVIRAVVEELLR